MDSFRRIDRHSAIDRSLRYPYAIPARSYRFVEGRAEPIQSPLKELMEDRIAVIGYGSNSSVEALDRKYRDHPDMYQSGIPVLVGQMPDFSVVYASQFSTYGALPATIQPNPGSLLTTAITFLTEAQLERMHDTEDVDLYYSYEQLDGTVTLEDNSQVENPWAYVALGGSLQIKGEYLALEAITQHIASGRFLSQREAQQTVIDLLDLAHSVEDFISENALNETVRNERFRHLSALVGDVWHLDGEE